MLLPKSKVPVIIFPVMGEIVLEGVIYGYNKVTRRIY